MRVIAFFKDDATFKNLLPYLNESAEIIFVDENNKITDKNSQPLPYQNIVECLFASKWDYILTQGNFIVKQLTNFGIDPARIIDVDFILNDDYVKKVFLAVGLRNKISNFESVIVGDFAAAMGFNADEFILNTANLASSCQDLKISYLWLKAALTAPKSKIKYAVIGLSPHALRYDLSLTADKWQALSYYSIFKGQMKFPLADDVMSALFDENFLNACDLPDADLDFADPFGEKELNERNLEVKDTYGLRTYVRHWEEEKFFRAAQKNAEIFIDCLKLCREHNVTPIIVKLPVVLFYKTVFSKEIFSELENLLCRAQKIVPFRLINAFDWNIAYKMESCRIDVANRRGAKRVTHATNMLIKNMHNTKMKIAFITQGDSVGKGFPVYKLLHERDDTDIYLLAVPPLDDGDAGKTIDVKDERYIASYNLISRNYANQENTTIVKVLTENEEVDLSLFHFDYVFYIRPYEWILPPNVQCQNVARFAKTCYIPYCVIPQENFIEFTFKNADFFNNLNFYFSDFEEFAEIAKQAYKTDDEYSDQHFLYLGSPEMEDFGKYFADKFETNLNEKRKSVMWAPRWTYNNEMGGSHFLEYKDNFTALRTKYPDLKMSVRPHRNLFDTMVREKKMTEEEVQAYKDSLEENNIHVDLTDSMKMAFTDFDILISDLSSIMPLYFLTGKPIIYCDGGYNLFGYNKIIEKTIYRAENWEDVEKYLEMLLSGEDPMKDERRRIIPELHKIHEGAAEKIVQCIIDDYYKDKK